MLLQDASKTNTGRAKTLHQEMEDYLLQYDKMSFKEVVFKVYMICMSLHRYLFIEMFPGQLWKFPQKSSGLMLNI